MDSCICLQVRPLSVDEDAPVEDAEVDAAIAEAARKIELLSRPHPYLHGSRAIFGVMPDWNPAEIIGVRPRPLSLSLYRELITDAIWAYQRDNYGYQNCAVFRSGQLSRTALHRRACQFQFLYPARRL